MLIKIMSDLAFWGYGINFLFALYGLLLFAWWWKKLGHATEVYAYITMLFMTEVLVWGGNVHIRILKSFDQVQALAMSDSLLWATRTWLHAFILGVIIYKMTRRVIRTTMAARRFTEEESDVQNDGS